MNQGTALTPQEVADILKIAKNTVYELIKRGELSSYRVGHKVRVDMQAIEEYKNRSKTKKTDAAYFKIEATKPVSCMAQNPLPYEEMPDKTELVICGQDVLLDILSRYLELHPNGGKAFRSYTGSYNALYSLYQGNVQMATAHLWDGDTGLYNIPYVRRMLPGIPAVIIHLACRMQGFYVVRGNPKGIKNWEDFKREDISMINREKGSGTRVLLDEHLRLLNIPGNTIKGYMRECTSHLTGASTVARGDADLAIGNEKAALQVEGIDFIPIQKERYELIIKKEDIHKPQYQAVLEIIRSDQFKSELEGIGGYDLAETGKVVAQT